MLTHPRRQPSAACAHKTAIRGLAVALVRSPDTASKKIHRKCVLSAKATFFFLRYRGASWVQKRRVASYRRFKKRTHGAHRVRNTSGDALGRRERCQFVTGCAGVGVDGKRCRPGWAVCLLSAAQRGEGRESQGRWRRALTARRGLGAAAGGVGAVDAGDDRGASKLLARACVMRERIGPLTGGNSAKATVECDSIPGFVLVSLTCGVVLCSLPPPSTHRARWGHPPTSARHAAGRDTLHRRGIAVHAASCGGGRRGTPAR